MFCLTGQTKHAVQIVLAGAKETVLLQQGSSPSSVLLFLRCFLCSACQNRRQQVLIGPPGTKIVVRTLCMIRLLQMYFVYDTAVTNVLCV